MTDLTKISVILLAGGLGNRMGSSIPKQYLLLGDKPIVRYSFDLFLELDEIEEIIVVCSSENQHYFHKEDCLKRVIFALPGERRQDSVFNGLKCCSPTSGLILIHDGARPFIDQPMITRVVDAAKLFGAATAGMPVKFTIKESDNNHLVQSTPDRSTLWEVQTPQVLHQALLKEGFEYINQNHMTVTDDVSLAELIHKKVKLVEGSHTNLKITVPSDLFLAESILHNQIKRR